MIGLRLAFVAFAFLVPWRTSFTFADEYRDPSGFSFTYPGEWAIVRPAEKSDVLEGVHPEVRRLIKQSNIDLRKIAVMVARIGPKEFPETVTFTVSPWIPIDGESLSILSRMPAALEAQGHKIEDVQTRMQRVGGRRAMVVEYRNVILEIPRVIKQKQVVFACGDKTLWATYSAPPETYEQYEGTFDSILATLKTPLPLIQKVIIILSGGAAILVFAVFAYRKWGRPRRTLPNSSVNDPKDVR
jgi:hypothetical protein